MSCDEMPDGASLSGLQVNCRPVGRIRPDGSHPAFLAWIMRYKLPAGRLVLPADVNVLPVCLPP
ncbi:hypothetical protein, partial [Salmonella enterica]|uniref:hypothetical protein n=1 Tax=Salmonella enterica TaxID=28901 RepID=UPI001C38EA73